MSISVEKQIDELKRHFKAFSDTDLAEKLGGTRSAISQWRFKKKIPKAILIKYADVFAKPKNASMKSKNEQIISLQEQVIELQQKIIKLQKNK